MLRDLWNRIEVVALATYITVDIWLFHKFNEIEDFIARRK
jgi:hypothetical protein